MAAWRWNRYEQDVIRERLRIKAGAALPPLERTCLPHVWLHGKEHKSCGGCGKLLELAEFRPTEWTADRLETHCQTCRPVGTKRDRNSPRKPIR